MAVAVRLRQAWNTFLSPQSTTPVVDYNLGDISYGSSPTRPRMHFSNERSIIASVYTTMSMDVAGIPIRHVQLDEEGRYSSDVDSELNKCLTFQPNLDQAPRSFRQDLAATLFDKGVAAIVPVDTSVNPNNAAEFDIYSLRVGEVMAWHPAHVKVSVYNEQRGKREEVTLPKSQVAIVENPLYSVMNEPNSTLQRLVRKLNLLDIVDEQSSSGKLDLIIQLPYVIKSDARRAQAEKRREDIEFQLKGSQYGIAYTDGTEKITQLNRPAENNLLGQIETLTTLLYSQLGITESIMDGTADEDTMLNYYSRTIEPILDSIVEAMVVTFVGRLGLARNESIRYYRNPFKFVPIGKISDIADKLTRNEIMTGNEMRGVLGIPPSKDPKADKLTNSNMPQPNDPGAPTG